MQWAFRIAHELRMTVEELEARMDAHEFVHWVAYFRILSERR